MNKNIREVTLLWFIAAGNVLGVYINPDTIEVSMVIATICACTAIILQVMGEKDE